MSQSIILCEGNTDFALLQMYMREVHNWEEDKSYQNGVVKIPEQKSRIFKRDNDFLTVMATGGCSRIIEGLDLVLDRIIQASPPFDMAFKKIVIITDNDEIGMITDFISNIESKLIDKNIDVNPKIENKKWNNCKVETSVGVQLDFQILILVIPHDHEGAMETFLLDAISQNDDYDRVLIDKCKEFVRIADPENRYLNKRCYRTKAEFSTYFCIRTPADAYQERHSLMKKSIKWSDYALIRNEFAFLKDL